MGSSYLANPVVFLIETLFGLYILLIMLRFILQWVQADFYNPVSQFIVKVTSPPLIPMRRVIPPIGRADTASLVLMLLLQMLSTFLVFSVVGMSVNPGIVLVKAIADLAGLAINVFLFAILIQVIISWINPGAYNPATALIHSITEPLLRPARRLLPPISGMDLSPIVVMLGLQILKMLLLPPIYALV